MNKREAEPWNYYRDREYKVRRKEKEKERNIIIYFIPFFIRAMLIRSTIVSNESEFIFMFFFTVLFSIRF
jgi:hypothetical protein